MKPRGSRQTGWTGVAVLGIGGACVLGALGVVLSVGRPQKTRDSEVVGGEARWACEMGCEKRKTYEGTGTCPVCKMPLARVSVRPYQVRVRSIGEAVVGVPTEVRVGLLDPDGEPAREFDSGGGRGLLVVFVSEDLAWVHAAAPELPAGPDAWVVVPVTFPSAGRYEVYAEFRPQGLGRQVPSAGFTVGHRDSAGSAARLEEDFDTVKREDDYEFRVRCNGARFSAGVQSYIRFGVNKGGESIGDFGTILGEPAHALILQENPRRVIMTHAMSIAPFLGKPGATDPNEHVHRHTGEGQGEDGLPMTLSNSKPTDVVVSAVFPEPGLYRVIACFDHRGKFLAVPFTIDAQAGAPRTTSQGASAADVQER